MGGYGALLNGTDTFSTALLSTAVGAGFVDGRLIGATVGMGYIAMPNGATVDMDGYGALLNGIDTFSTTFLSAVLGVELAS